MYPRLGLFGPSFVETWDEMRNENENNTQGKITGDQTSISHLGSSTPSFWFFLTCAFTSAAAGSYSPVNQAFCQNKILQILGTDTQFHEMIPNFAHFMATLKFKL
jgi:hypothetical protein